MFFIRQGATHKVVLGPFVDVGDGFTPETGVTLAGGGDNADEAEAILHDFAGAAVVDISAYTWAAIGTADGYYVLTLQNGISGTVGHLTIVINNDSVHLPVRADFTVLDTAAYDALFKDAALGPALASDVTTAHSTTDGLIGGLNDFDGTGATLHGDYDAAKTAAQAGDEMLADLTKIHGSALNETAGQLAGRFEDFFNQAAAAFTVATALADFKATGFAVASDVTTAHTATDALITTLDTVADGIKSVTDNLPDSGALTDIGTDTARLTAVRAAVLTDWIDGERLDVILDAIPGGNVTVGDLTAAALAKFSTEDTGETTPVAGSVAKLAQGSASGLTAADVADAVHDEALADHTASGSAGEALGRLDDIQLKTDGIGTGLITVVSPVADDGDISLMQYDDYDDDEGRSLEWTNADGDWGTSDDITDASVEFIILNASNEEVISADGAVVTPTGTQKVRVELTNVITADLTLTANYTYQLRLILDNDRQMTIATGAAIVTASGFTS